MGWLMLILFVFRFLMRLRGRCNINHGQDREDIGLDDADEEAQGLHDNGEKQGSHGQEDGDDLLVAHEIAEEPDSQ